MATMKTKVTYKIVVHHNDGQRPMEHDDYNSLKKATYEAIKSMEWPHVSYVNIFKVTTDPVTRLGREVIEESTEEEA